jgi:hypothetical protein
MTPKEKAKDLIDKYQKLDIEIGGQYDGYLTMKIHDAKECALIAVDECINIHFNLESDRNGIGESFKYWQEVKSEIEKI